MTARPSEKRRASKQKKRCPCGNTERIKRRADKKRLLFRRENQTFSRRPFPNAAKAFTRQHSAQKRKAQNKKGAKPRPFFCGIFYARRMSHATS